AFAASGFERKALYPCYGLAEATLMVTGGLGDAPPVVRSHDGRELVGCGRVPPGIDVRIVDPDAQVEREPGRQGEIWIKGAIVAAGYWTRAAASAAAFGVRLAGSGDGPYLRTGDLGFMHDGELFVTGRIKDLIIIRGKNHYPHDIELTVEGCHDALRPG